MAVRSEPRHVGAWNKCPGVIDPFVGVLRHRIRASPLATVAGEAGPEVAGIDLSGVQHVAIGAKRAVLLHLFNLAVANTRADSAVCQRRAGLPVADELARGGVLDRSAGKPDDLGSLLLRNFAGSDLAADALGRILPGAPGEHFRHAGVGLRYDAFAGHTSRLLVRKRGAAQHHERRRKRQPRHERRAHRRCYRRTPGAWITAPLPE